MTTVQNIMQIKGNEVWCVTPETPALVALQLMDAKNIGALVVIQDKVVAGILSERDFARKMLLKRTPPETLKARDIMTFPVITVTPGESIDRCMELMTTKRIRHLPVVEDDDLRGLISMRDVVKAVIAEKEHLIRQLENYITGAR